MIVRPYCIRTVTSRRPTTTQQAGSRRCLGFGRAISCQGQRHQRSAMLVVCSTLCFIRQGQKAIIHVAIGHPTAVGPLCLNAMCACARQAAVSNRPGPGCLGRLGAAAAATAPLHLLLALLLLLLCPALCRSSGAFGHLLAKWYVAQLPKELTSTHADPDICLGDILGQYRQVGVRLAGWWAGSGRLARGGGGEGGGRACTTTLHVHVRLPDAWHFGYLCIAWCLAHDGKERMRMHHCPAHHFQW